ncbi:hypothetical protein RJ640_023157 [Escallonia rubra]|uniref:Timeless N-terminal domain-containing protein n=1 Tax=Escallonia rubra TaxID=112253 RepID=A0AA88UIV6_9ASTE|nr:hypothetical protein RJ640_023157 [Escallonia rubra]
MEGLSTICAGLGIVEEDDDGNMIGYTPGEYCLDNLKDLLRFLRRDDPQTREVFKQVCKWNTVGKDLIPIIEHCQGDHDLVLNSGNCLFSLLLKVLVFLTMPVEPMSNDIPQQVEYLWGLKSAITCSDTVTVIVSLLESPLENLEQEAFTEDDWKLVQLVLTLFRNILAVQNISVQQKVGGSALQFLYLRDRFLELLFQENVMDLILVLTQHVGGSRGYFRHDNLLLLETFYYIFMGQDAELIAKACMKGSKVDGDAEATVNSLRSIMEEEAEKKKLIRLRNKACYSQFSGTFTRVTMDGSKALCKGNPCSASRDALLKAHKTHRGPLKRAVWDDGTVPSTKENILRLLHDFINQFLSGAYNVLMQSIREDIEKEHHAIQKNDVVVFFQVARFVTAFQYRKSVILETNIKDNTSEASPNHLVDRTFFKGSICGPIAASMNESMFLLVIMKWRDAFDGLKETKDHKFLSAAGSLMKIMIRMLDLVLKRSPEDSREPQTARILLYKLFYDQTDQGITHFLLNLIKSFDTHKQAKSGDASRRLPHQPKSSPSRTHRRLPPRSVSLASAAAPTPSATGMVLTAPAATIRPDRSSLAVTGNNPPVKRGAMSPVGPVNAILAPDLHHHSHGRSPSLQRRRKIWTSPPDLRHRDAHHRDAISPIATMNSGSNNRFLRTEAERNHSVSRKSRKKKTKKTLAEKNDNVNETVGDYATNQDETGVSSGEQSVDASVAENKTSANPTSDGKGEEAVGILLQGDKPEVFELEKENGQKNEAEMANQKFDNAKDNFEVDDSSGDDHLATTDEVDFKVATLVSALANSTILQNLCWLLKFYKSNSTSTNHYIICMFRRICDDLELSPMLYQLSLLTTFHEILEEQKSNPCKEYENIVAFLTSLVRRMLRKMKSYPLLFVEVLFWKTRKECHYINCESMLNELGSLKKECRKWGDLAKDGEVGSAEGNGWTRRSIADALGDDEADIVISHRIDDQNETHSGDDESETVYRKTDPLVPNDEMEAKIKLLYEKFKDDQNCNHLIGEALDLEGRMSPVQIAKKLKKLGVKFPTRKRKLHAGSSNQLREEAVASGSELEDNSSVRRPTFKDQKRCSYMIANALDADGKFTAAQVSRKLRQLGLRVPQQKRSNSNLKFEDEDLNEFSPEDANNSDNETLLSLSRRRKSKQKLGRSVKRANQETGGKLSADDSDSDDLLLSSVLGIRNEQSTEMGVAESEDAAANHDEAEATGGSSGQNIGLAFVDKAGHLQCQQLEDELADDFPDFGDDETPVSSEKAVVIRRKLRMVVDLEDDE